MLARLLESEEPSVRLRARAIVSGSPPSPAERLDVRSSARVTRLLSERLADGSIPLHPYAKWRGAHWVLVTLADLGHPPGDSSLAPLREQVLAWLLSESYEQRWVTPRHGRSRLHASQDANAVWALLCLGLADERVERLVARLLAARWPDGGWNCDPRPRARVSSFEETLIPLRALARYGAETGDDAVRVAVEGAAEVFLARRLFRRLEDGSAISERFLRLAYPPYWHYDVLFALKVLAEAGHLGDARCADALEVLEAKRLPDGGFPAEIGHYRGAAASSNGSLVGWGGTSRRRSNEWVTCDAFGVLAAAGRPVEP
jgi:hypothetical protein